MTRIFALRTSGGPLLVLYRGKVTRVWRIPAVLRASFSYGKTPARSTEIGRRSSESVSKLRGDCEDSSIMLTFCWPGRIDAAFLVMPSHVAAGVAGPTLAFTISRPDAILLRGDATNASYLPLGSKTPEATNAGWFLSQAVRCLSGALQSNLLRRATQGIQGARHPRNPAQDLGPADWWRRRVRRATATATGGER